MVLTNRQKIRVRTLPTRKPTSRKFSPCHCLDCETWVLSRGNVIKVGNDHQTSMSAFIHLPPGDTWDQPDDTFIFRRFRVCFSEQCRVSKNKQKIKKWWEKKSYPAKFFWSYDFHYAKKLFLLQMETWVGKLL